MSCSKFFSFVSMSDGVCLEQSFQIGYLFLEFLFLSIKWGYASAVCSAVKAVYAYQFTVYCFDLSFLLLNALVDIALTVSERKDADYCCNHGCDCSYYGDYLHHTPLFCLSHIRR